MNKLILSKLLVISLVIISMYSCGLPYCKKHPFSEEDLTWMNPYAPGDTIYFQCNELNSIDTMIVKEIKIYNPTNTFIFDLRDCNWMEDDNDVNAYGFCDFDILHNGECFSCVYMITKVCNKKPAEFYIRFLGWFLSKDLSTGSTDIKNEKKIRPIETLIISDSILQATANLKQRPDIKKLYLKKLYWNRERGLTDYQICENWYHLKR